jgi:hypothetical protein
MQSWLKRLIQICIQLSALSRPTNIHIAMDNTSNNTLIALFEMLNDRLYNIEQSNNVLIEHLKNKSIRDRILEKKLFGFPIDVHTYYHGSSTIDANTIMFVSHDFPDIVPKDVLSIYKPHVYEKVKPFVKTILTSEQEAKLDKSIQQPHLVNGRPTLLCSDFGVKSFFVDIGHHIMNAFVTHYFKNVKMLLFGFECHYNFVLRNMPTVEKAVEYVSNVFHFFDCSLADFSTFRNHLCVTLCCGRYDLNLETLLNVPLSQYHVPHLSKALHLKTVDIERYIEMLQDRLNREEYDSRSLVYEDKISIECNLETLQEIYEELLDDESDEI